MDASADDPRPITAADLQRALQNMQTALSPERMRMLAENAQRSARLMQESFTRERLAEIAENAQRVYSAENMRLLAERAQESMRLMQDAFTQERLAEMVENMRRAYSSEELRRLAAAAQAAFESLDSDAIAAAAREFQADVATATAQEGAPTDDVLGFLASLPAWAQLALLLSSLKVLDALNLLVSDIANEPLPDEVKSATALVFCIATLLLMVIQLRQDDDGVD